jgi:hypothetical protein
MRGCSSTGASTMIRAFGLFKSAMIMAISMMALVPSHTVGQPKSLKDDLIGSWKFVSSTSIRDDDSATWGHDPVGSLIFTGNGRFSLQIMRSDRPKYKSNTRMRGSLIENQATTRGTLSYFGTYDVNESNHTLTFHVVGSSFPNYHDTNHQYSSPGTASKQRIDVIVEPVSVENK